MARIPGCRIRTDVYQIIRTQAVKLALTGPLSLLNTRFRFDASTSLRVTSSVAIMTPYGLWMELPSTKIWVRLWTRRIERFYHLLLSRVIEDDLKSRSWKKDSQISWKWTFKWVDLFLLEFELHTDRSVVWRHWRTEGCLVQILDMISSNRLNSSSLADVFAYLQLMVVVSRWALDSYHSWISNNSKSVWEQRGCPFSALRQRNPNQHFQSKIDGDENPARFQIQIARKLSTPESSWEI